MAGENNQSRVYFVRTKIPHADHLVEKANNNPDNPHNHVATEINLLIKKDFEQAQKKKIRK